jgi:predicted transcriptional regulator
VAHITSEIVLAYIANNAVAPDRLPNLIKTVYRTPAVTNEAPIEQAELVPALPIKKSVSTDYLI